MLRLAQQAQDDFGPNYMYVHIIFVKPSPPRIGKKRVEDVEDLSIVCGGDYFGLPDDINFRYNNLYVVYVTNFLKSHWDVTMMLFF